MGGKQLAAIIVFKRKAYFCSRMRNDLSIGGTKLSYRKEKIVLGENFSDHRRQFFRSPKQVLPLS